MAQIAARKDEEIRKIRVQYAPFYPIVSGIALVIVGIWIGSLLFTDGYATNVYTDVLSAIATIVVLDRLSDWRETKRHQKQLIRQAKGQSNELAKSAIHEMRAEGWLTINDEVQLLKGADLSYANLKGAKLGSSNLQDANLFKANLEDSDLLSANLEGAYLNYANLREAKLGYILQGASLKHANMEDVYLKNANLQNAELDDANLQNADLRDANLHGTTLIFSKLQGANLDGANLQNADLRYASLADTKFTRNTVLPDAEIRGKDKGKPIYDKYWTPETDMDRYTEPNHPDFWQPDWVKKQKEQYD